MGYHRAGFEVVGVDIHPQPNYPFEFHCMDATLMQQDRDDGCWHERGYGSACLGKFDAIHASPPCQRYTTLAAQQGTFDDYPDLVAPMRDLLVKSGLPYVIENVPGAPLEGSLLLCGAMFGLRVIRHRCFESNVLLMAPGGHPEHLPIFTFDKRREQPDRDTAGVLVTGWNYRLADGLAAMGIDWMKSRDELSESIPPAYTEWVGTQLLNALKEVA
jgi:DNA (cytosine-5)-methyltransferase 1